MKFKDSFPENLSVSVKECKDYTLKGKGVYITQLNI